MSDVSVIVHRGAYQIGGCITEIRTARSKVVVDLGQNFPYHGIPSEEEDRARVSKLFGNESRRYTAVVITHSHLDHTGLLPFVPKEIPIYMSKGTKWGCPPWLPLGKVRTWVSPQQGQIGATFWVGDIGITPIAVSHSVFDSSMLLITAGGKRILHTGDFRLHGWVQQNLCTLLYNNVLPVDVLITEGTMLGTSEQEPYEEELVEPMADFMKRYRRTFVLCSPSDVERLATINHAAALAGKKMCVTSERLAQMLRFYKRAYTGRTESEVFAFNSIYRKEEVPESSIDRYVYPVLSDQYKELRNKLNRFGQDDCGLIFASWPQNYLNELNRKLMPEFAAIHALFHNVVDIHTTGHALPNHIAQLAEAVQPREAIVCIHSDCPQEILNINLSQRLAAKVVPFNNFVDWITIAEDREQIYL